VFGRKSQPAPEPPVSVANDWSRLSAVRAEWPKAELDPHRDHARWREGTELYDAQDDYAFYIRASELICHALRHELYGQGLLDRSQLIQATNTVIYGSTTAPPGGRDFPPHVATQLRLALTVTKKYGWQSTDMGGGGQLADLIADRTMVLAMAVAPSPERPWEGNLREFFTMNPLEPMGGSGAPDGQPVHQANKDWSVDSVYQSMEDADAGDPAAEARMRGLAAQSQGDLPAALAEFERSGQMGDPDSMFDAGMLSQELGMEAQGRRWLESAADAGQPVAAFNLGMIAYQQCEFDVSRRRLQQAGEGGQSEGYAALTQLADETNDAAAEEHWSQLGAEAGHPFCQLRYGQLLMQANPNDRYTLSQRALPLLQAAAAQGQTSALFLIGIGHAQLGDLRQAREWLLKAEASGDTSATRVLAEHGLR
jgi:TPR repeat protein